MKKPGKKRKDWIRKAFKRDKKKKDLPIVDFMTILFHFFEELPQYFNEMNDPRNPSYITYTQADLIFMGILKNVCSLKSMRSMEENFNEETCIQTLKILSGDPGLDKMPHMIP